MKIQISGIENLSKVLEKIDINKNGEQILVKVANEINKQAKLKTPVRTSRLRKGWRVKKSGNLEYIVYNNVKYAKHVEYGHRVRGKKGAKMVVGRFMLRDSVNEVAPKFVELVKKAIFD